MAKNIHINFVIVFCGIFMKGGSFSIQSQKYKKGFFKMNKKEYNFYNNIANWSFDDINYTSEIYTKWIFEDEIKKRINSLSKVLDLGTAAGEKVLKNYPECAEILGTDFSEEMIKNANINLKKSGRKNITFRVMDNLNMDTPDNYFDIVTARHTVTAPNQIYKTLKNGGYIIIRGVDKLDCWQLKRLFNREQTYNDIKPISQQDYEAVLDAGFKDVELIPLHIIEYYKTKEDLYALLLKTQILDHFVIELINQKTIEAEIFEKYVEDNKTDKGIKLIRRYYGIIGKK